MFGGSIGSSLPADNPFVLGSRLPRSPIKPEQKSWGARHFSGSTLSNCDSSGDGNGTCGVIEARKKVAFLRDDHLAMQATPRSISSSQADGDRCDHKDSDRIGVGFDLSPTVLAFDNDRDPRRLILRMAKSV